MRLLRFLFNGINVVSACKYGYVFSFFDGKDFLLLNFKINLLRCVLTFQVKRSYKVIHFVTLIVCWLLANVVYNFLRKIIWTDYMMIFFDSLKIMNSFFSAILCNFPFSYLIKQFWPMIYIIHSIFSYNLCPCIYFCTFYFWK